MLLILLSSLFLDFAAIVFIVGFLAYSMSQARSGNKFDNPVMDDLEFISKFDFNEHEKQRKCFSAIFHKVWSDKKGWLLSQISNEKIEIFEAAYVDRFERMLKDQEIKGFYSKTQFSKEGRQLFDSLLKESRKTFVELSNFNNDEIVAEHIEDESVRIKAAWKIEELKAKLKKDGFYPFLELLK